MLSLEVSHQGVLSPRDFHIRHNVTTAKTTQLTDMGLASTRASKQSRHIPVATRIAHESSRKGTSFTDTSMNFNEFSGKDECFSRNSKEWLQGPRLGNANESVGLDYDFTRSMVLHSFPDGMSNLLRQSFCHEDSRFVNSELSDDSEEDTKAIRLWTVRLLYLIWHRHQHGPAELEARLQLDNAQCLQARKVRYELGPMDWQCPTARFLVVRLYHNGLGANLRMAAVPALMAGLASGRVVLFINNAIAETNNKSLQTPWTLASCPRRDFQCIFAPLSPCTVTLAELAQAYTLQRKEMRRLFRMGTVPVEHAEDRVVILSLTFRPQRVPENLPSVLYNQSLAIVQEVLSASPGSDDSKRRRVLELATRAILQESAPKAGEYSYYGASSPMHHALLLYAMRPNPDASRQIQEMVKDVLPNNFDPEQTLGLPIRGVCMIYQCRLLEH